ncbi:MAG: M14 family metallopeptidase [Cyclobacteriaceae bacterium]|nr:M14 family metallopeptidase [Cyclobacteriaceae bacterium]
MRSSAAFFYFLIVIQTFSYGQSMMTPGQFLGYELGDKFTYHHRVLEYFNYVRDHSENVLIQPYGKTYEGRELLVAYVSSPQNLARLEQNRLNNISITQEVDLKMPEISIVWLSYNVHGNEASSTETAMKVLHELAANASSTYKSWLDKLIIIIDPCLNPDGRDRYVNWYNQVGNRTPNPGLYTREHDEEWPGGRTNHYSFDLNRDWVWQTQIESQQRLQLYNSWLPQVHVDFHEQYYNDQYFFAPSAKPIHSLVSPWQMEFQDKIGDNNAKYFDEKGWLYFTGERFDLLYPGYGDTYPTFSGAIGMTYEMAGHSISGLAIITEKGDTLRLKDRIDRHYTTSIATIETSYNNRERLLLEFRQFFTNHSKDQSSFLLKSSEADKLQLLADLLDKNAIEYQTPVGKVTLKGLNPETNAQVNVITEPGDLVIPLNQPKAVLAKVLLEPRTTLSDTLTYDITAWSLPYVYGVQSFQIPGKIQTEKYTKPIVEIPAPATKPYAWLLDWRSIKDAAFLAEAQKLNFSISYSSESFTYKGKDFSRGTIVFTRNDNEKRIVDYETKLLALAQKHNRSLFPLMGGAEISDISLGSSKIKFMKKPQIALAWDDHISSQSFGEMWYFLEQELNVQADVVSVNTLGYCIDDYDVLILPSGHYNSFQSEEGFKTIDHWINDGGTLILVEDAIRGFTGEGKFSLKSIETKKSETDSLPLLYKYNESERESLKNYIQGSIYKVTLDNTHPLAYGYGKTYYTIKNASEGYSYLADGWNVGHIESADNKVAGFSGAKTAELTTESLVFGVENRGRGSVVYFVDSPVFRGFWQNGKLLLANALYFHE